MHYRLLISNLILLSTRLSKGSSGAPLFDKNRRVIGQLNGGSAACGNNLPDWFGRFSKSWELGLSTFLDPDNTGVITTDTLQGITNSPTTQSPSSSPTTSSPTSSANPTKSPSTSPTLAPSSSPTISPTTGPSLSPSKAPSNSPTENPTKSPSSSPSLAPTPVCSNYPTEACVNDADCSECDDGNGNPRDPPVFCKDTKNNNCGGGQSNCLETPTCITLTGNPTQNPTLSPTQDSRTIHKPFSTSPSSR